MKKYSLSLGLVLLGLCFWGCSPEKEQTATRGRLRVLVPESAAPVLIQEIDAFLQLYRKNGAEISYSVVSNEQVISTFLFDSLRAVFTTRPLTQLERQAARSGLEEPLEILLAYDAIAAVVHYKNPVNQITTDELRRILRRELLRWESLSRSNGMRGRISIVMQDSSDVTEYLGKRLLEGQALQRASTPSRSSLQTLQEVVHDERAIGFVGINWLDSARVPAKVLEIAQLTSPVDTTFRAPKESIGKFYSPHPAHVYRGYYPLRRGIYYLTRSRLGDLASGLGSFVTNKEGQKIFLHAGLVPATQPIRLKPSE